MGAVDTEFNAVDQNQSPSWSDYGQALKQGAYNLEAAHDAGARWFRELIGDTGGAEYYGQLEQAAQGRAQLAAMDMSDVARQRLEASIASKDFLDHPLSSIALKATGMAPAMAEGIASAALPGPIIARVIGGAIAGGAINSEQVMHEVNNVIDNTPDETLQKQSEQYANLRKMLPEPEAREQFNYLMQGPMRPILNFLVGAGAAALGPEGIVARGNVLGAVGRGRLGSAAIAAGENAAAGAVQGAVGDASVQAALNEALGTPIDESRIGESALEGGVMGAAVSAPFGLLHGGARPTERPPPAEITLQSNREPLALPPPSGELVWEVHPDGSIRPTFRQSSVSAESNSPPPVGEEAVNPVVQTGNQPPKNYGTGNAPPPPAAKTPEAEARTTTGIGNPQNETTSRVPSNKAKDSKRSRGNVKPQEVEPGAPDATQLAALTPEELDKIIEELTTKQNAKGQTTPQEATPPQGGPPQDVPPRPSDRGGVATLEDLEAYYKSQKEGTGATPEELNNRSAQAPKNIQNIEKPPAQAPAQQKPKALKPLLTPEGKPFAEQIQARIEHVEKAEHKSEQQKARYENAETEEERIRASHKSPEWKEAAINRIRQMRDIVEAHAPKEGETPDQTFARAKAMAEAAKNVKDLDLSKPLRGARPAASHAILKQAYRLANAKTKKVRDTRIQDFLDVERSARSGNKEILHEAVQAQRAQGEMAKRAQQRSVENISSSGVGTEGPESIRLPGSKGVPTRERPKFTGQTGVEELPSGNVIKEHAYTESHKPGETGLKERPSALTRVQRKLEEAKARAARNVALKLEEARKKRVAAGRGGINDIYEAARKGEIPFNAARDRIRELLPDDGTTARKQALKRELKKIDDLELAARIEKGFDKNAKYKGPMVEEASVGNLRPTREELLESAAEKFLSGSKEERAAVSKEVQERFITPKVKAIKEKIEAKKAAKQVANQAAKQPAEKPVEKKKGAQPTTRGEVASNGESAPQVKQTKQAKQPKQAKSDTTKPVKIVNTDKMPPGLKKYWDKKNAERAAKAEDSHLEDDFYKETGEFEYLPKRTTVKDALTNFVNTKHLRGVPKAISNFMIKRFIEADGDVPIHFVTSDEMLKTKDVTSPGYSKSGLPPPKGLFRELPSTGIRTIYVLRELKNDEHSFTHAVLHEIAHDMTSRVLKTNLKLRSVVRSIMSDVRQVLRTQHNLSKLFSYALQNEKEFIAEAFSNPRIQEQLAKMEVSKETISSLQELNIKPKTLWDAFVDTVHTAIRKLFGVDIVKGRTAIEAIIKAGEYAYDIRSAEAERFAATGKREPFRHVEDLHLMDAAFHGNEGGIKDYIERPTESVLDWLKQYGKRTIINALTPNYQFAEGVKHLIPSAPKIVEMLERMGAFSEKAKQEGRELAVRMIRAKNDNPDNFDEWSKLMNDQTIRAVRADYELGEGENTHLGLSRENMEAIQRGTFSPEDVALRKWAQRAVHRELSERYKQIISRQPELAQLTRDYFDYTRQTQSDLAGEHISKILQDAGVTGVERYRLTHELTSIVSAERWKELSNRLGEAVVDEIKHAKQLQTGVGPYSPLVRHGDWVVHGEYKYDRPENAVTSNTKDHVYEFNTRKEAHDFAVANVEHQPDVFIRRYDPVTGERINNIEDAKSRGAIERYEVQIDPRHIEFHESEREALRRQEELHESGLLTRKPYVEQRREYFRKKGDLTATDIHNLVKALHKNPSFKSASAEQRRDAEQALVSVLRKRMSGHRVRSASLPRRGVKGASTDIIRNFTIYTDQMANTRARARFMPVVEHMLQKARQIVEQMRYQGSHRSELDPRHTERSVAMEELDKRAHADDPNEYNDPWTKAGRSLIITNYIDRMMRPFHLLLHQTHLPMITLPHIGGSHGHLRTFKEAAKIMARLGLSVHKKGFEDFTGSIIDPLHQNTDYGSLIRSKFRDDENYNGISRMLKYLEDTNTIHPRAGFEVERYRPSNSDTLGGWIGTNILGRADSAFRALTDSTEAINRYVGAITAYKLEYAKQRSRGATAEKAQEVATKYARDAVIRSEGLYSGTNAAPLFKNRVLKPFLQFRQFPLMMYHLLAHNASKAFMGATREERLAGAASLLGIIGTHTLMTGLLGGLPMEIPKILAWSAKTMGITNSDWTDFERWQYEKMAELTGKEGADWIMHGAGRHIFGADLHHRLGINSIIGTFGIPDYKYTTEKQLAWLTEFVTGAPGGLVKDIHTGTNELFNGDVVKGALHMLPFQVLRDWEMALTGGRGTNIQYTPAERVIRALGATPTKEAEFFERQHEMSGLRSVYNDQRSNLIKEWTNAKNGQDKIKAWAKIQQFNKGYPREAQITMQALNSALKSKAPESGEDLRHHLGLVFNKNTKWIAQRDRNLYSQ